LTNPRSLNFQVSHLVDLYRKLPRHAPDDVKAIEQAMTMLRGLNLEMLDFPLPGSGRSVANSEGQSEVDSVLRFIQNLLPSWADNISLTYFNHARTFPISIGG